MSKFVLTVWPTTGPSVTVEVDARNAAHARKKVLARKAYRGALTSMPTPVEFILSEMSPFERFRTLSGLMAEGAHVLVQVDEGAMMPWSVEGEIMDLTADNTLPDGERILNEPSMDLCLVDNEDEETVISEFGWVNGQTMSIALGTVYSITVLRENAAGPVDEPTK